MQLIWVSGPVGRIYKLDLTLKKLIIGLFVTIFLSSLFYFLSQVNWLRQATDFAEYEDTTLATIVDADLRKKLVEIYSELEFTHKKIKDLETLNQKLVKLTVPPILLPESPVNKNGGLIKSPSGGPFLPPDLDRPQNIESLMRDTIQLSKLNSERAKKSAADWARELHWISNMPIALPIKDVTQISSGFGMRLDPFNQTNSMHTGLDFVAPVGTTIYATGGGVIRFSGWSGFYGKSIEIDHGDGYMTRYGHASELLVVKGQRVEQHQAIARVGSTGRSTGPHLHYEVFKKNQFLNPTDFIAVVRGTHK